MSFKFRLEKVLTHRKSIEELAKRDYLAAQSDLLEAENLLHSYYEQIATAQKERHTLVIQGGNQGESLSQIYSYIQGTEVKIERQKQVVQKHLAIVEEKKLALQEAASEYKMIEKLKKRQLEEYRLKEKKLEEKNQNEISNSRFEMRRRNE